MQQVTRCWLPQVTAVAEAVPEWSSKAGTGLHQVEAIDVRQPEGPVGPDRQVGGRQEAVGARERGIHVQQAPDSMPCHRLGYTLS